MGTEKLAISEEVKSKAHEESLRRMAKARRAADRAHRKTPYTPESRAAEESWSKEVDRHKKFNKRMRSHSKAVEEGRINPPRERKPITLLHLAGGTAGLTAAGLAAHALRKRKKKREEEKTAGAEKLAISEDLAGKVRVKRIAQRMGAMMDMMNQDISSQKGIDELKKKTEKARRAQEKDDKSSKLHERWEASDRSKYKAHDPNWRVKAKAKKMALPAAGIVATGLGAYALHRRRKKKKAETAKEAGLIAGMEKAAISYEKAQKVLEERVRRVGDAVSAAESAVGTPHGRAALENAQRLAAKARKSAKTHQSWADHKYNQAVKAGRRQAMIHAGLTAAGSGAILGAGLLATRKKDKKKKKGQRPQGPHTPRKPAHLGDETRQ